VEFLDLGFVSAFRNLFLFCFFGLFQEFLERAARPASWFGALEIINTRVLLIQGFSIQCVAELLDLGSVSAFGNLLLFFFFPLFFQELSARPAFVVWCHRGNCQGCVDIKDSLPNL
jgi:hypothetical protein